jgi:hypothetical protein
VKRFGQALVLVLFTLVLVFVTLAAIATTAGPPR